MSALTLAYECALNIYLQKNNLLQQSHIQRKIKIIVFLLTKHNNQSSHFGIQYSIFFISTNDYDLHNEKFMSIEKYWNN